MPAKKTKKQLADEAWLRAQEKLALVEQPQRPTNYVTLAALPTACPKCGWATRWPFCSMFGDLLQCNGCAQLFEVPRAAFVEYLQRLHDWYAALNAPKPKAEPKRAKGAR